jgi:hypothetical protein
VATVVARSREFHWVVVDRDRTPDAPKRWHVSAYPSLLLLGPQEQNIHRFSGFKPADGFLVELEDGLRRWALFRDGKDWDAPRPRPEQPFRVPDGAVVPAPSDDVPGGVERLGDDLWVAQGRTAFALDPATGEIRRQLALPVVPQDLATDGRSLFVVDAAWTSGAPILVLDPKSGAVQRQIVTKANAGARSSGSRGLCWHDGKLFVLEINGNVHRVDPATGDVEQSFTTGCNWVFGLASDGRQFATVGRTAVHFLDPRTLQPVGSVPSHYRLRAIGWDGKRWRILEQPEFGFGRAHEPIRVWPQRTVIWALAPND